MSPRTCHLEHARRIRAHPARIACDTATGFPSRCITARHDMAWQEGGQRSLTVCAKGGRHVPNSSLTIEQMLALLAAAPPRLAALTTDLAPAQLRTAPTPGEWSANEVLAHLRACADV